jgi:flagella basal body P-ring formation protein FlgA
MRHAFLIHATRQARWFLLSITLASTPALAQQIDLQDPAAIQAVARTFITDALAERVQALGGTLRYTLNAPESRLRVSACSQMQAYQPPGARSTGRTLIGVRCLAPRAWQVFLAADIHIDAPVWVAARALPAGHQINPADLEARSMEVSLDGPSARLVPAIDAQIVGQTLARALPADSALRNEDLRDPAHINPGDAVEVVYVGSGFRVSTEGKTLGAASPGQTVQVRMAGGMVVTGTLNDEHVIELHL